MASAKPREGGGRVRRASARRPHSPNVRRAQERLADAKGLIREPLLERLEMGRTALLVSIDEVAHGLDSATRRASSPVSRRLLKTGGRVLRSASAQIDEHSVEELLERAGDAVRRRPGLTMATLLGAGVVAGRLLRARTLEAE